MQVSTNPLSADSTATTILRKEKESTVIHGPSKTSHLRMPSHESMFFFCCWQASLSSTYVFGEFSSPFWRTAAKPASPWRHWDSAGVPVQRPHGPASWREETRSFSYRAATLVYIHFFSPLPFYRERDLSADMGDGKSQSVNGAKGVWCVRSSALSLCSTPLQCFRSSPSSSIVSCVFGSLSSPRCMPISLAMTMTSPVEVTGKAGWFDSLRRNRRNKSVSSPTSPPSASMTGAKSLSSLHTLVKSRSTSTAVLNERLEVPKTSQTKSLSSWRSILSRSKVKHSAVVLNGNLNETELSTADLHPAAVMVAEKEYDKNLSSAFCTLPRKRPTALQDNSSSSNGGRSLPPIRAGGATSSRSRSYSIASLDRRNKRSTVWYTHSEGDILNKNRVSLFLQALLAAKGEGERNSQEGAI